MASGLKGDRLTEKVMLADACCVAFSQAEVSFGNTQVLQRTFQYACTFGYAVWLRPQDYFLGQGVASSDPLATRMGLSGVPVMAETIAMHTIFELMRNTGARVHLCRVSKAAGVALVRQPKADGLKLTCDVSINSLHRMKTPKPCPTARAAPQRDRHALRVGLADGTIDPLVSDHTPVLTQRWGQAGADVKETNVGVGQDWERALHAGRWACGVPGCVKNLCSD